VNHFTSAGPEEGYQSDVLHLLYHELTVEPAHHSYQVQADVFGDHLVLLATLQKVGAIRPHLTFDDGHGSNFQTAFPMLQEHGMKANFFITAGWIEKREGYMTWSELRSLQRAGHYIGAHGWSHQLLTNCNREDLQKELSYARKCLEDGLGQPVNTLSFPGGRFNRRVLQASEEAGYTRVYTSVPRVESLPFGNLVGRVNIRSDWGVEKIASLFDKDRRSIRNLQQQEKVKSLAKSLLGDTFYAKLWSLGNRKNADDDLVPNITA